MRIGRQARRDARTLYRACRKDGLLNEDSVRKTVRLVLDQRPRGHLGILNEFQRLVRLDIQRRTARVESAEELEPAVRTEIAATLEKQHGAGLLLTFAVDPTLIGGLRIQVGSQIFDGSISGRLSVIESLI
jgi:F-type H+-transporting ATPase subunit delta